MPTPWTQLRTQLAAARILVRHLGVPKALGIGRRVSRLERSGHPFEHLEPPENQRERLSRQQIGPAILLYQELQELRPEEALTITREVVMRGAVLFLRSTIGSLDRVAIARMSKKERRAFATAKGEAFFNATTCWNTINQDEVSFTVTACRFPDLCATAGVPELAPVFCEGDAVFFAEQGVILDRPVTIANGGESCPFTLRWASGLEGESQ